jgi:hypothetical protein
VIGRLQAIPVLIKLLAVDDATCVGTVITLLSTLALEVPENRKVGLLDASRLSYLFTFRTFPFSDRYLDAKRLIIRLSFCRLIQAL